MEPGFKVIGQRLTHMSSRRLNVALETTLVLLTTTLVWSSSHLGNESGQNCKRWILASPCCYASRAFSTIVLRKSGRVEIIIDLKLCTYIYTVHISIEYINCRRHRYSHKTSSCILPHNDPV